MSAVQTIYIYMHIGTEVVPAGLLKCEVEGGEVVSSTFRYGKKYLSSASAIPVDIAKLPLREDEFHTDPAFDIFTGIKDAIPDSWGRAVMERRAGRIMREDEFLLASSDQRVGALSFSPDLKGPRRVCPWNPDQETTSILDLDEVFAAYLKYTGADLAQFDEAMRQYLLPGSSLGGARPKASCRLNGDLWLAKFQRENDAFDFVRAEFAAMNLASQCGITIPEVRIEKVLSRSVYLIKRFDRSGDKRWHFNSSLAILGETELSFMHSSYMDLAVAIRKYSKDHLKGQKELFRRMVFNGLVRNNDDHLRNHGFLFDHGSHSFVISPAYDIVPNPLDKGEVRLAIGCGFDNAHNVTREFSKPAVLRTAGHFGLTAKTAEGIFDQIRQTIHAKWEETFKEAGFSAKETQVFSSCFV